MTKSTWALIPMKTLEQAKTRLATVLTASECAELSRAMLLDVLSALHDARRIDQIAVLTSDTDIQTLVRDAGHLVIEDDSAGHLNAGLNKAVQNISAAGAATVVIVHGDLPTISGQDIDQLLAEHSAGISLCVASHDGGTNALVCSPSEALPFRFGPNSAQLHLDAAADAGIPAIALHKPAFGRDIDTPDDLFWLTQQNCCPNSIQFLQRAGINTRMNPARTGTSA